LEALRVSYITLLRDFRTLFLWGGQLLSEAGDRLYAMAMLWLAYQLTGSASTTALASLSQSLALTAVGLAGGVLIDRVNRFRVVIWVDVLRALLVLSLPLAASFGALNFGVLVGAGICLGALNALFEPALNALLPSLVPREQFPGLAGLMDTPSRFARLLGPGSAGLLLSWMPVNGFFWLDAASFLVSAGSLVAVRRWTGNPATPPYSPSRRTSTVIEDVRAGLVTVWSNRRLRALFISEIFGNAAFAAFSLGALFLANSQLHSGLAGYGWLIGGYGAGSLIGNFVCGNLGWGRWRWSIAIGGWAGIGLSFALLGETHSIPLAIVCTLVAGMCGSMAHVARSTWIGQHVSDQHLGKVYSLQYLSEAVSSAIGAPLCGLALDHASPGAVLVAAGAVMVTVSGLVYSLSKSRNPDTMYGIYERY
jgi:DHA3 family macrolide efflux protein-like MFS transporter